MSGHVVAFRYIAVIALRGNNAGIVIEISYTLQTHTNKSSSQSESNRFVHKFSGILFGLVTGSYEVWLNECIDGHTTTEFYDENNRC